MRRMAHLEAIVRLLSPHELALIITESLALIEHNVRDCTSLEYELAGAIHDIL